VNEPTGPTRPERASIVGLICDGLAVIAVALMLCLVLADVVGRWSQVKSPAGPDVLEYLSWIAGFIAVIVYVLGGRAAVLWPGRGQTVDPTHLLTWLGPLYLGGVLLAVAAGQLEFALKAIGKHERSAMAGLPLGPLLLIAGLATIVAAVVAVTIGVRAYRGSPPPAPREPELDI
jgi:hypothetical protein